jgi:FkbM family methyltransferase
MLKKIRKYKQGIDNLGLWNFVRYLWRQKLKIQGSRAFFIGSHFARFPLRCRPNTSAIDVFKHIYIRREYECLDDVSTDGLIVDCGANAGFSTTYFINRFPKARVIAVEPDPGNYDALLENLRPYAGRFTALKSAIWSKSVGLTFAPFGDGREWARSVREVQPGETPVVNAIDIATILKDSGAERISILKVDIEGAEAQVFAENYESWLDKVDNLVIELHGEACTAIYRRAVDYFGFQSVPCGGLTVSKRRAASV